MHNASSRVLLRLSAVVAVSFSSMACKRHAATPTIQRESASSDVIDRDVAAEQGEATPQLALEQLVVALQRGSASDIRATCSERGYALLIEWRDDYHNTSAPWSMVAALLRQYDYHWSQVQVTEDRIGVPARQRISAPNAAVFVFKRRSSRWVFDDVLSGE